MTTHPIEADTRIRAAVERAYARGVSQKKLWRATLEFKLLNHDREVPVDEVVAAVDAIKGRRRKHTRAIQIIVAAVKDAFIQRLEEYDSIFPDIDVITAADAIGMRVERYLKSRANRCPFIAEK